MILVPQKLGITEKKYYKQGSDYIFKKTLRPLLTLVPISLIDITLMNPF